MEIQMPFISLAASKKSNKILFKNKHTRFCEDSGQFRKTPINENSPAVKVKCEIFKTRTKIYICLPKRTLPSKFITRTRFIIPITLFTKY